MTPSASPRRHRSGRRPAAALFAVVVALGGCSLLLDPERTQCSADEDCRRFANAICDRRRGLCIASVPGVTDEPSAEIDARRPSAAPDSVQDLCARATKPRVRIEGDVTADATLTCDKDYLLVGNVFVKPGVTLTIARGTTLLGDPESKATLVVQPGARLVAAGEREWPIVFTSARLGAERAPGDWGGVILLGRARVNAKQPQIEGITEGGEFGGDDDEDSSGVLRYVRIEYAGVKIAPNNEVNGLTFGGVGRRTVVDFVQVRHAADDCFEFFGGAVDAKHLVCHRNGDDGFDWDNGYRGRLQFLVLQQDPTVVDETNGFEGDNDPSGSTNAPQSAPVIYNATLIGKGNDVAKEQYGILVRRGSAARIFNTIALGFEAGLDLRDRLTEREVAASIFFGNAPRAVAYEENGSDAAAQKNDDDGFDENAWIGEASRRNATSDPLLRAPFDAAAPDFRPAVPLTENAASPPDDGFFDPRAAHVGAFRDAADDWMSGAWVVWGER